MFGKAAGLQHAYATDLPCASRAARKHQRCPHALHAVFQSELNIFSFTLWTLCTGFTLWTDFALCTGFTLWADFALCTSFTLCTGFTLWTGFTLDVPPFG